MSAVELKVRLPLAFDATGKPLYINVEWLNDLNAALAGAGSGASNTSTLTAKVESLVSQVASLTARVEALEGGYQA